MKRKLHIDRRAGFTLAEIMIVVGVIGLLAAVGIPSFTKARTNSITKTKEANVRLLNQAVEMWAMDTLTPDSSLIGDGITNYIKGGLSGLAVGSLQPGVTSIIERTVDHIFTVSDLY